MNKFLINHRSPHHGNNSGYDLLTEYIDARIIPGPDYLPLKLTKFIISKVSQEAGIYDSVSVLKEWELFKYSFGKLHQKGVVHYLAGERDIRFAANYLSYFKKIKLCATFHKPNEILKNSLLDLRYIKKLNGAIAVGVNQVEFLKEWIGTNNVQYIPHGVDTSFFVPDSSGKKLDTLLFVGQHLRDFDAFNYAVPRLVEKKPGLKFQVVLRNDAAYQIKPHHSIELLSGVDDLMLRELYQKATALFLPLKDATACNALLEAISSGLPVISTFNEGSNGYLNSESAILVPGNDMSSLVDETLALLNNQDKLIAMGLAARENSLTYDWNKIAHDTCAFYETLF